MYVTMTAERLPTGRVKLDTAVTLAPADFYRPEDELAESALLLADAARKAMDAELVRKPKARSLLVAIDEADEKTPGVHAAVVDLLRRVTPTSYTPAARAQVRSQLLALIIKQRRAAGTIP